MNAEPLLKVRNLSVDIINGKNTYCAVEKINFSIMQGEICGIVGESGCGKSLTALSIAGLLPPAAKAGGSIFFGKNNNPQNDLPAQNNLPDRNLLALDEDELCSIRGKEISMIFQEPLSSLNPLMKIGRQITEVPEIHNKNGDKKQNLHDAALIMEKLGLENPALLMDSYPFRLSGGMCQRVMIAIAMICGPQLLIADEPTTALDEDTQDQILTLLKEINKSGTSILFISHDLGVIREICDRVMVMYAGKIMEEGSAEDIFSNPAHEYTRSLLGALPERGRRGEDLKMIPGKVPSIEEGITDGCPFAPRCTRAIDICLSAFPGPITINENHITHCVLWELP